MLTRLKHLFTTQSILFWIGIVAIGVFAIYKIHLTTSLSFSTPPSPPPPPEIKYVEKPLPTHIAIQKAHIDLDIYPTVIRDNTWEVDENGASYLSTSSRPGENGPIILYGHNTYNRFGPIRWLRSGDQISITTSDSQTHNYVITQTLTVKPSQIDVLSANTETLIIYTCTGVLDSLRFIIKATPVTS